MSKTYILSLEGICVGEDEIENTTIHICRNGEWCEIPFDIDDIVSIEENEDERLMKQQPLRILSTSGTANGEIP
jgi:hypothetical protein